MCQLTFTAVFVELGRAISATDYIDRVKWAGDYTRRMASWWAGGHDLLLPPTLAGPPPEIGELVPDAAAPTGKGLAITALIPYTPSFNVTGQPAVSLPLAWNEAGLPLGMQFVGAYGREDLLIRLASQLEEARPWAGRRPPLFG